MVLPFAFQDELEVLRARLEKSEKERQDLKHENEKLEARVSTHRLLSTITRARLLTNCLLSHTKPE